MAHALDLVGERWALLVVRELVLGPKRFTDLRAGIPNASPNVLSQRLRELERYGVVRRRRLAPPAASWVYELTEWGKELEPVIIQLGRWGIRSPAMPREAAFSVDALILALRTMFSPDAAAGFTASYELRIGRDRFRAVVVDRRLEIRRGRLEQPDAIIEADVREMDALLWGGRPLKETLSTGEAKVYGNMTVVERFLGLFPLPEPVAPVST